MTNEVPPNYTADWTSDDEARWNEFLKTPTGRKLIPKALEASPGLLPSGESNAILIRSGEIRGIQHFVKELLNLTHAPPLPAVQESAYPDLDDDSKWAEYEKQRSP